MLDPLTAAWLVKHFGLKAMITYRSKGTGSNVTCVASLQSLLDHAKGVYQPGYIKNLTVDMASLAPEKMAALKALGFTEAA